MTKRLVLARHAQVDPDYAGRFIGNTDVRLSELGARQASALARSLPVDSSVPLYVSPLRRTVDTAVPFGRNVRVVPDLREIDFGRWEGRTFDEISASDSADQIDAWSNFDPEFSFPGGESLGAFVRRAAYAADSLADDASDVVVAITHGGVIRAMICHLLGLDPSNYLLFDVQPASVTTIDLFDGRGVLSGMGDTSHLNEIR